MCCDEAIGLKAELLAVALGRDGSEGHYRREPSDISLRYTRSKSETPMVALYNSSCFHSYTFLFGDRASWENYQVLFGGIALWVRDSIGRAISLIPPRSENRYTDYFFLYCAHRHVLHFR